MEETEFIMWSRDFHLEIEIYKMWRGEKRDWVSNSVDGHYAITPLRQKCTWIFYKSNNRSNLHCNNVAKDERIWYFICRDCCLKTVCATELLKFLSAIRIMYSKVIRTRCIFSLCPRCKERTKNDHKAETQG